MVKIVDMDGCGGSLIAPGVVLSAGHCGNYDDEEVSVGAYNRGDGESRTVLETRFHPNYDDDVDNDFMLLRLNTPVNSVETVKVNDNSGKPNDGQDLTVLGLGDLEEDGNSPNTLHDVVVQAVSDNDCEDAYGSSVDSDIMFCAGVEGGGKDSCQGDSGGPIVIKSGSSHVQVGVVSWGDGCARPDAPGVYARVSSAFDWIKDVVCDEWNQSADFCDGGSGGGGGGGGGGGDGTCVDIPNWHDSDGSEYTCNWYANEEDSCDDYGDDFSNMGHTANTACCTCGGGTTTTGGGGNPDPTPNPTPEPTPSPTPDDDSSTCSDVPNWHDSDGPEYTCSWYANEDDGCADFGDDFANMGHTANTACCTCGGGTTGGGDGGNPDPTPEPTPSPTPDTSTPEPTPEMITPSPTPGPTPGSDDNNNGELSCNGNNNMVEFKLELETDDWGYETEILMVNRHDDIIFYDWNFDDNRRYEYMTCLDRNGCTTLDVFDSYGDGIESPGYIMIVYDGEEEYSGGDFGYGEIFRFGDGC